MERNEIKMNETEKQAVKLIEEKETLNNLDTELGRYLTRLNKKSSYFYK